MWLPIVTHNWLAPNVSGFIAQLVEHRTGNREVTGSNPVEVMKFFSGFFTQLHKLRSLRDQFFIFIISLCVWLECVCVLPVNEDVTQAIIDTFHQYHFQKVVGWVAFKVSLLFSWSLNRFKCDGQCLFLSYLLLALRLGNVLVVDHHVKKYKYMYIYSLGQLDRLYIEDITRWREDMNFIFEWQNNILRTSAASE